MSWQAPEVMATDFFKYHIRPNKTKTEPLKFFEESVIISVTFFFSLGNTVTV